MVKSAKILYFFFILLITVSCNSEEGTFIKGKISNLEYPYILASYLSSDTLAIDTISADRSGHFKYTSTIDTLTTFSLYLNNYESAVVVFANEGEKLTVNGDAQLPDLIKVNGNEINDDLTTFKTENEDLLKQRGQLFINLQESVEFDTIRNQTLARHDELTKLNMLNHELTLSAEEFIKNNPAKLSSLIMINNFFMNSDNPGALERVLGYLQGDIAKSAYASSLKFYSEKMNRSAEGAKMPYFQLEDREEKKVYSHDFNGKYLLLSFISMSGVESRETVELLRHEYAEVNKDSVEFVTVYIDSDIYPDDYADNDSIPWIVIPEKRSWGADIVDNYNVQYIPYNILIAPDGNIKVRNIPSQGVADMIGNSSEDIVQ
jgi:peroxiredoxin